mmetsp:Transcript_18560/g.46815  ORF Transcript_18560/g.46815 Transcript_18560/m.46815 type:complete len:373 (-) Transcript_18560:72-1190(-)
MPHHGAPPREAHSQEGCSDLTVSRTTHTNDSTHRARHQRPRAAPAARKGTPAQTPARTEPTNKHEEGGQRRGGSHTRQCQTPPAALRRLRLHRLGRTRLGRTRLGRRLGRPGGPGDVLLGLGQEHALQAALVDALLPALHVAEQRAERVLDHVGREAELQQRVLDLLHLADGLVALEVWLSVARLGLAHVILCKKVRHPRVAERQPLHPLVLLELVAHLPGNLLNLAVRRPLDGPVRAAEQGGHRLKRLRQPPLEVEVGLGPRLALDLSPLRLQLVWHLRLRVCAPHPPLPRRGAGRRRRPHAIPCRRGLRAAGPVHRHPRHRPAVRHGAAQGRLGDLKAETRNSRAGGGDRGGKGRELHVRKLVLRLPHEG